LLCPPRTVALGLLAALLVSSSAARAASSREAAPRPETAEAERAGPLDRVRIGPIVGMGFPRPLAVEALVKIDRRFALGAEYSFAPEMTFANVDTRFRAVAADLRWFPWKGGFFLGVRAGRQWLDARTTISAGTFGSTTETMEARAGS